MGQTETHLIHYQSYLLRLWRDDLGDVRQATLQSTITEKIQHFASLQLLLAFLATPPNDLVDEE